jgi:fumarate hydratase, class II
MRRSVLSTRTETDSFGAIEVPTDALWRAQTERSRRCFAIGEQRMPPPIIHALAEVKRAAAEVNAQLGLIDGAWRRASSTTHFHFRCGRPARARRAT